MYVLCSKYKINNFSILIYVVLLKERLGDIAVLLESSRTRPAADLWLSICKHFPTLVLDVDIDFVFENKTEVCPP